MWKLKRTRNLFSKIVAFLGYLPNIYVVQLKQEFCLICFIGKFVQLQHDSSAVFVLSAIGRIPIQRTLSKFGIKLLPDFSIILYIGSVFYMVSI